jgi:hypothetical protein
MLQFMGYELLNTVFWVAVCEIRIDVSEHPTTAIFGAGGDDWHF